MIESKIELAILFCTGYDGRPVWRLQLEDALASAAGRGLRHLILRTPEPRG